MPVSVLDLAETDSERMIRLVGERVALVNEMILYGALRGHGYALQPDRIGYLA